MDVERQALAYFHKDNSLRGSHFFTASTKVPNFTHPQANWITFEIEQNLTVYRENVERVASHFPYLGSIASNMSVSSVYLVETAPCKRLTLAFLQIAGKAPDRRTHARNRKP
jgi:hypothetical protein